MSVADRMAQAEPPGMSLMALAGDENRTFRTDQFQAFWSTARAVRMVRYIGQ